MYTIYKKKGKDKTYLCSCNSYDVVVEYLYQETFYLIKNIKLDFKDNKAVFCNKFIIIKS